MIQSNLYYFNEFFIAQCVVMSPQYPEFLKETMRVFLKILQEGDPQFIAEQNTQVTVRLS